MKTACVILAAGQGKRMKSELPKVLHEICGNTLIGSVLVTARRLKPDRIVVVAGTHIDSISRSIEGKDVSFVLQNKPMGTGHALSCARSGLKGFHGDVVVMNGDTPLVGAGTIGKFLALHRKNGNAVSVLSFRTPKPDNYGRIVRDEKGSVAAIIEEKDADALQREIEEVNSGVYAIRSDALSLVEGIRINRAKGEYYLTDIAASAAAGGMKTAAYCIGAEEEFMGVNTREELLAASRLMRKNIILNFIQRGVYFIDPDSVFVGARVAIGKDAVIYPGVYLEGNTKIGKRVKIFPNVRIVDSDIGSESVIKDSTVIESSRVRERASVGPFAHLRPGSEVGADARVGNFVELKKTTMGRASKASHLSYLGDATIGKGVNIGAGAITCNYDGRKKHPTVIDDDVFIGSDSQLVAPVRVGRGAYVGAGSTITEDVPSWALAISRAGQKNIRNWAKKKRAKATKKG